jgi:hypothetical protein
VKKIVKNTIIVYILHNRMLSYNLFPQFAELRPKNCVLAAACGTHAVCVCIGISKQLGMWETS